jgi:hypothetical protein
MKMIKVKENVPKTFHKVDYVGDDDDDGDYDSNGALLYQRKPLETKWEVDKAPTTISLVFKDFLNFVCPGPLETHAKDFGGVKNTKSHMAYEAYDNSNHLEVLSETCPSVNLISTPT